MDKGYDYDEVRELGKAFGYTLHIRPRGEEAQAIKRQVGFKARRWVVERTHSWMNRFRSVLIRWDKQVVILTHFRGEKEQNSDLVSIVKAEQHRC